MSAPLSADKALLDRLPLPLAQLYRRSLNAKSPRDAHDFAFYLWESALKLLASSAIVTYQLGEPDPAIDERLKVLARPSLGHWWEIVRLIVPRLAERNVALYRARNEELFGKSRTDLPRCAGLDAAITESSSRSTVQVGELFEHLIAYRNRTTGHGAPAARTPQQFRSLADAMLLAAAELFDKLDVLAGRRLVYVSEVRPIRGVWLVERAELHGVVPWRVASLEVPRDESSPSPLNEGVYLSDSAQPDDTSALVPLSPLVVFDADAETALILNKRRNAENVELLCYVTGRVVGLKCTSEPGALASGVFETEETQGADTPRSDTGARRIGEYDIIGELGRGAMGVVYRAFQPSLHREVALKVQPRAGDAKADARFRREIRALGRVEHPHVVKVYTSGSDGNQFYYTMELVEGAPLAAISDALTRADATTMIDLEKWRKGVARAQSFSREAESSEPSALPAADSGSQLNKNLGSDTIRHLVALIRQVAEAAHALHEKGIIHRDIKPGNVLVSSDGGNAVLMDLGLAQLADDLEGRLTRTRQFVGTLRYASPQQVLAVGQLDRRADVYSLGATLWELLALRPLFAATDQTPTPQLMEQIQRDEPERLRRVNKYIPRDLEAIVHKCLEKSPEARYATAQELANDLLRWLEGEPVRARKVSAWEREWKWIKRRPVLSGLVAALVLAIAGGSVVGWVYAAKAEKAAEIAREERDRAAEEKRIAESVRSFLQKKLLRLADTSAQMDALLNIGRSTSEAELDPRISVLLDRAAAELTPERAESAFPNQTLVLAEILHTVGNSYFGIGKYEQAIYHLERSRNLRIAQLGISDQTTIVTLFDLATAYREASKLTDSIRLFEQLHAIDSAKNGADNSDMNILSELALTLHYAGQVRQAVGLLERVHATQVARFGAKDSSALTAAHNLADGYRKVGKFPEAIQIFENTRRIRAVALGADHPTTLITIDNLALTYQEFGNSKKAVPLFEQARDGLTSKLGMDHPHTLVANINLATAYRDLARFSEAERILEQVRDTSASKLGFAHQTTLSACYNLATTYQLSSKLPQATRLFEHVRDIGAAKLGPEHPIILAALFGLANSYIASNQPSKAIEILAKLQESNALRLGASHPQTLITLNSLAAAYHKSGKLPEAITVLEQVRDAQLRALDADHPSILATYNNLAMAHQASGDLPKAISNFRIAAAGIEKRQFKYQGAGQLVTNFARCLEQAGEYLEAEAWRRRLLAVAESNHGRQSGATALELIGLGGNLIRQAKHNDAEAVLREGLVIQEGVEKEPWRISNTKSLLGESLIGQQNFAIAEQLLIDGFEGLKQHQEKIPSAIRNQRLSEAIERLVRLFENSGRPEEAAKWRKELKEVKSATAAKPVEPKKP